MVKDNKVVFKDDTIEFKHPKDFSVQVIKKGSVKIYRIRPNTNKFELNLMVGVIQHVIKLAAPTKITEYGGQSNTETLSKLFLGTLTADAAYDSGSEAKEILTSSSVTLNGYKLLEQSFFVYPNKHVFQTIKIVLNSDEDIIAVVAGRGQEAIHEEIEIYVKEIAESIKF